MSSNYLPLFTLEVTIDLHMIWPQKYKLKQKTRFTRLKTALQENMATFLDIQVIKVQFFFQIFNH